MIADVETRSINALASDVHVLFAMIGVSDNYGSPSGTSVIHSFIWQLNADAIASPGHRCSPALHGIAEKATD